MNIFHKTQKKETHKLPMTGKVRKGFRYYCAAVLSLTAIFAMSTTAFAASDPLTVVNNLSDFIFGFIRAIGLIKGFSENNLIVQKRQSVRVAFCNA